MSNQPKTTPWLDDPNWKPDKTAIAAEIVFMCGITHIGLPISKLQFSSGDSEYCADCGSEHADISAWFECPTCGKHHKVLLGADQETM
jgi:Zn finger protein HypA/HybF involved in hydrogenase expression